LAMKRVFDDVAEGEVEDRRADEKHQHEGQEEFGEDSSSQG
jgi:hypothetical protein